MYTLSVVLCVQMYRLSDVLYVCTDCQRSCMYRLSEVFCDFRFVRSTV